MKIYFDMDGVLADFDKGVNDIIGIPYQNQDQASMQYHDFLYEHMRKFPDFYYMLEPIQEMVDYLLEMYQIYGDNVEILTGIPTKKRGIDNARDNKIEWVKKYINDDIKVNICYRKDKVNYVKNEDDILIDDFNVNIKDWIKYGGTGIIHKTLEETRKELNKILNEKYLWYACYGSNLLDARFKKYLDKFNLEYPIREEKYIFNHPLYFANEGCKNWDCKGIAYIDMNDIGKTYGWKYLIKKDDFKKILHDEGSTYEEIFIEKDKDNFDIYTISSNKKYIDNEASHKYLDIIGAGLIEKKLLKENELKDYLNHDYKPNLDTKHIKDIIDNLK